MNAHRTCGPSSSDNGIRAFWVQMCKNNNPWGICLDMQGHPKVVYILWLFGQSHIYSPNPPSAPKLWYK